MGGPYEGSLGAVLQIITEHVGESLTFLVAAGRRPELNS